MGHDVLLNRCRVAEGSSERRRYVWIGHHPIDVDLREAAQSVGQQAIIFPTQSGVDCQARIDFPVVENIGVLVVDVVKVSNTVLTRDALDAEQAPLVESDAIA